LFLKKQVFKPAADSRKKSINLKTFRNKTSVSHPETQSAGVGIDFAFLEPDPLLAIEERKRRYVKSSLPISVVVDPDPDMDPGNSFRIRAAPDP
jgi:hypothetical protein